MRLWLARMLVATLAAAGLVAIPASPALAKCPDCHCLWKLQSTWAGGYQAEVTVTNLKPPAYEKWLVTWTFQEPTDVTAYWNAVITTSGTAATAVNASHNGVISAGASVTFGFVARAAKTPRPPLFQVDHVTCPHP